MPNILPIYNNVMPNTNYASDEASGGQNGTQKTEYQGRNIIKNSESASILLRHKPHLDTETDLDSNQTWRHAGMNFEIDVTPPEIPAKPTVAEKKLTNPPQLPPKPKLGATETLNIPSEKAVASKVSSAASIIGDDGIPLSNQRNNKLLLAEATLVKAPDGKLLPANRVQIADRNVAMISEYPKTEYLESYFKMLSDNQTPLLVVLASNKDIETGGLPEYFKQSGKYGSVSVKVEKGVENRSAGKFNYDEYQIEIKEGKHSYQVPVIHINNWQGKNNINNEGLKAIADRINLASHDHSTELYQKNNKTVHDLNKVLPVIHGSKGYDRSAFLVAATQVSKLSNKLSAEKIINEIKNSTSAKILDKTTQLDLLKQFEETKGNYIRDKRSSAKMDEGTTKLENATDTDILPTKLKRMLSDPEVPAPPLPPRRMSAEDQQQTVLLAKDLFQRLADNFSDVNIDKSQYIEKVENQRFGNIWTAKATAVTAPNGQPLPANRVQIAAQNVAIACQYPKPKSMEDYFKMLVANRTPALVVLASEKDINPEFGEKLPEYFRKSNQYGDVLVTAKANGEGKLADRLDYQQYLLQVTEKGQDAKVTIPVIHVPNWPDRTASGNKGLRELAELVNAVVDKKINMYQKKGSRAIGDKNKLLPVIHCRAGVGRTGQLLATMELIKPESNLSLEKIVTDMRNTRNRQMVQTSEQMQALAMLAVEQGKPISDKKA
ncbi:protein-tyrosine phosphatase family protein [Candidatus Arsenophonus nilaparvatae]|uniref:protein-tyrosine phosphatase family protein n=1 Tax=Candidatus Arsenophonus nilaparvatae TaxID=1247023 RepID=UPI0006903B4E|nr:protein-tyrosine phosphatase family protein [Candidatus Arsenophonus nilaparvatae]